MIRLEDCYKIGRLGKTHGVKGEISMLIDDDVFDRTDADYVVLMVDGILVPFFIEEYRFKTDSNVIMKFCDIDSMERAAELTGCDVYFPRELSDDGEDGPTLAAIVGYSIIDKATGRTVGTISGVDDSTANTLFEMADGRLIPATDELIAGIDQQKRTLTMQLPEGLLEL